MITRRFAIVVVAVVTASLAAVPSQGAIQMYPDLESWLTGTGAATSLDFEELPVPVEVTDQYLDVGLFFDPGEARSDEGADESVSLSNFALDANLIMFFTEPIHAVAFDTVPLTGYRARLYLDDEFVGISSGSYFSPYFHGFTSDVPFDRVELVSPTIRVSVDSMYFQAIPGAGSALVMVAALLGGGTARSGRRRLS